MGRCITRRKTAPGTLQVRQRIWRVFRSITMASPKLFAMNATRWLSGEISARSPKYVRASMLDGRLSSWFPGLRWAASERASNRAMARAFI